MSNSYLKIAKDAIRQTGKPLHPKEILEVAEKSELLPDHLFGKTQYKTLAARLSTEIRARAHNSPFYRTAANRFFLRELHSEEFPEFHAPKREKTLHHESVLTVADDFLQSHLAIGLFSDVPALLGELAQSDHLHYVVRSEAEKRFDVKQFISYALVVRGRELLTYRRGSFSNAADELQGLRSIGFGGHVTDQDLNLFDTAGLGIVENARRELAEELVFDRLEMNNLDSPARFELLCGINTYGSKEAQKHIAIALVYYCTSGFDAQKNEMSINELRWVNMLDRENNLDDFEPWSRTILEAIYAGRLSIEHK